MIQMRMKKLKVIEKEKLIVTICDCKFQSNCLTLQINEVLVNETKNVFENANFCDNRFDHPAPASAPSTVPPHPTVIAFINTGIEIHANDILESRFDIVCDESGFVTFIGGHFMTFILVCRYFDENFTNSL